MLDIYKTSPLMIFKLVSPYGKSYDEIKKKIGDDFYVKEYN